MTKASSRRVAKRAAAKTSATQEEPKGNGQSTDSASFKLNDQERARLQKPREVITLLQSQIGGLRVQQKKLQAQEEDLFRQLRRAEGEFNDGVNSISEAHGIDPSHPTEAWSLDLNLWTMTKVKS